MDGTRSGGPLTDSALDRELESALSIEPSPEFLARARARLAAEPEPSPWRLAVHGWAVEPLWGVAIVGIALAVVVPQMIPGDRGTPPAKVAQVFPPAVVETRAAPPAAPAIPMRQRRAGRAAEAVHTVPLQLSPVMFAAEDRQAFDLFVVAAGEGRVPEEAANTPGDSAKPVALAIEPLVIDPLPVLARVQQQGEGQW